MKQSRMLSPFSRTAGWILLMLAVAASASACPVCDTGTGDAVRAGVFNEDFGQNLWQTLLPFPIFAGVVALVYFGPPRLPPRPLSRWQGRGKEHP
ncbi:MAG: hypothetical protein OHK0029_03650 [Armatimonadaceae bacterium]